MVKVFNGALLPTAAMPKSTLPVPSGRSVPAGCSTAMSGAPGVGWHDLEVLGAPREPPAMHIHGPARELADKMGVEKIFLSITHDAGVAAAVVILEGSGPGAAAVPSAPEAPP